MSRGQGANSRRLWVNIDSVQSGAERFPGDTAPNVAYGRNNLTAISLELDLYFVAELDQVLVFKPCFPGRRLGDLVYKWRLPVSGPNLQGYLDRHNPHAVNSMLIAKLGMHEVLVCACDDGDIILYYTHFLREISLASDFKGNADHELTPRPLMIDNVRRSAWGLAIHTNARKLAVSCNTHDVTAFAFGLTDDAVLYNDPLKEWQYPGRSKDDLLPLSSHRTNIPNVAFFNSDLDKEGRYLVSTDLTGVIVLWDLRERCLMKRIESLSSLTRPQTLSGWSVACVDPRSFLLVTSDSDLLGCKLERYKDGTYDITQGRSALKTSSIHYPDPLSPPRDTSDPRFFEIMHRYIYVDRRDFLNITEDQRERDRRAQRNTIASNVVGRSPSQGSATMNQYQIPEEIEQSSNNNDNETVDADDDEDTEEAQESMSFDGDESLPEDSMINPIEHSRSAENWLTTRNFSEPSRRASFRRTWMTERAEASLFMDSGTDDSSSDIEIRNEDDMSEFVEEFPEGIPNDLLDNNDLMPGINIHGIMRRLQGAALPELNDSVDAPFLLIHTGQDFVCLRKSPFQKLAVISRDPCYQHLPLNMGRLFAFDRLHLSQLIPELNVFVVATATGRAAIYTLTRKITSTKSAMQDEYGMRLDSIVPFTYQEERKQRPAVCLIGLAAAPVRGQSGHSISGQRWRLALTYHDHTVMNYELWREEMEVSSSVASFV